MIQLSKHKNALVLFNYLGVSKKLENACKKRDCATIRPWIKSSVNHCYGKQPPGVMMNSYNGHPLSSMLQISMIIVKMASSMRNDYGSDKVINNKSKIVNTVLYKTFQPFSEKLCFMYLINRIEGPQAVSGNG